ncbi:hypothetical protein B5G12_13225 [Faecalibacterium sp. An58]|nr:hypothetical protein B5G12_13225 [Faecalibacterium sp. An58]
MLFFLSLMQLDHIRLQQFFPFLLFLICFCLCCFKFRCMGKFPALRQSFFTLRFYLITMHCNLA